MDLTSWLLGTPQFWLGMVACAVLVLASVAPTALRPQRRVEVYRVYDRAPTPAYDPFYKPGRLSSSRALALETPAPFQTVRSPALAHHMDDKINEARKRAVWYPHPDDELPAWKLPW